MGIPNLNVLCQVTAFLLSFILSFFIVVPLVINQYKFGGHCLLYASGNWNSSSSQLLDISWGPNSACGFGLFIGVVLLLLTLFYLFIDGLHLLRETDSSWLDSVLLCLVSLIMSIMLFAESVTISAGLTQWCNLLTQPASQIVSCEVAEYIKFDADVQVDSSNFYTHMKMVEFGSWSCFICWLFLLITSVMKVVRLQRHETFMTSVNRERSRLMQKYGPRNRAEYEPVPS